MEFGKHIGKGLWAFADKALPAMYGIGFVFLVVRILPPGEFGAFVVIQTIFTMVGAVGYSFALQPLTKFAAEVEDRGPFILASLLLQFLLYAVISVSALAFKSPLSTLFDPRHQVNLIPLFGFVPLLLTASYYRSFAISLLQASYQVQKIFWIDAVYFIGVLLAVFFTRNLGMFRTAADMLAINVVLLALSSLVALVLTWRDMSAPISFEARTIRRVWDFGKYMFGSSVLYILFAYMDVFFVTSFAGVVAVATYNAAKVLTRINDMLSQVMQMFLVPFSSREHARREVDRLSVTAEKAICFSTILFLPLFLAMFFYPQLILHLLYKGKYDEGAQIVRALSFLALIIPWNSVVTSIMVGIGMVKEGLYAGIILLLLALAAYAGLTPLYGPVGTSIGLVVCSAAITLGLFLYLQRRVPIRATGVVSRTRDVWSFVRSRSPL